MKTYIWVIFVVIMVIASVGCSNNSAAQPKPLACGSGTFSEFSLTNTNERSYSSMGQTCKLSSQAEGVIWIASGAGHAMSDAGEKLVFKDEQGRLFTSTCWVQSGTMQGVTKTELVLFGPSDSQRISVCCGDTCVNAVITE